MVTELMTREREEHDENLCMSATYKYHFGTDSAVEIHVEYEPHEYVLDSGALRTLLLERYLVEHSLWTEGGEWIDSMAGYFYDELHKELYPLRDREIEPPMIVEIIQVDSGDEQHYAACGKYC